MIHFCGEIENANIALTKKELQYMDNFLVLQERVISLNNRINDLIDTAQHLLRNKFILSTNNSMRLVNKKERTIVALINDTINKVGFLTNSNVMTYTERGEFMGIGIKVSDENNFRTLVILPKKYELDTPVKLNRNGYFYGAEDYLKTHKENKLLRLQIEEKLNFILDNFDEFEKQFYDDVKELCNRCLSE